MQAHVQKLQLLKEEERDGLLLNPNCLQDKALDKGRSIWRVYLCLIPHLCIYVLFGLCIHRISLLSEEKKG